MTIPMVEYKGHELRGYAQQTFPTYHDPYASGPRRFSSIVRVSRHDQTEPPSASRYALPLAKADAHNATDAIALAIQYGKDIIDAKAQAIALI